MASEAKNMTIQGIRQKSSTNGDQAARLRQMARQRLRTAETIAIVSGKGGVGKSNIAVNLSVCLAQAGTRVTLVDLDMGLANSDLLMNIQPRYTLAHLISGSRTLDEIKITASGGIHFVPGGSGTGGLANLSEFERRNLILQLDKLAYSTDILIFDCGAGISRNVVNFAQAADTAIVVTTPEPPALTDAYAMVKSIRCGHSRARVRLAVNMAENRAEAEATYQRVASVARKFLNYSVANGGFMLHDTSVELAVRERCPFVIRYPESNASACIAAMARTIARNEPGQSVRGGFFRRVAGLFV
jgi:flagellar biosynthesis protein FlhG